jgi:hypothetical protein
MHLPVVLALLILVASPLTACGSGGPRPSRDSEAQSPQRTGASGIKGVTRVSQACGNSLVTGGGCASHRVAPGPARVVVTTTEGRVVADIRSTAKGIFRIPLPAGEYLVGPWVYLRSDFRSVRVSAGEFTRVVIDVRTE